MADQITMDSTVGEVYENPIGHDIIARLLLAMKKSEKLIDNPIVSRMKLRNVKALADATGKSDDDLWEAILKLANQNNDVEGASYEKNYGGVKHTWWKEAVFYQIYPRSFYDSNHDGIGDLQGIIGKLDYLKNIGFDALWLSPIYDSPNDDNGYDIRDYRKIMAEFGTMEDFRQLLAETHKRGMKLILDLVVNHTSDEHRFFKAALEDPNGKYGSYYFFRDDKEVNVDQAKLLSEGKIKDSDMVDGRIPPNNWESHFTGSAWRYFPEQQMWALHLFSKKQMDLNWDNPDVRNDVIALVNWWLDMGVDGFRMDVISFISKNSSLPQGDEMIGKLTERCGIEQYFYGPHLHEYLHELHEKAFAPHHAFSVGECPGLGLQMSRLLTGEEREELDTVFNFDHLDMPGKTRWDDYDYDLNYLRDYLIDWQQQYGSNCWMSLFYNNHDNPRMVGKITKDPAMRRPVERLLVALQMTLKGTPFVFQGDEMGLTNYGFTSMEQITDVDAHGYYDKLLAEGKKPAEAFCTIVAGTREHARVPLPWNEKSMQNTVCKMSYEERAAKHITAFLPQEIDESITRTYRNLIGLRHRHSALVYGTFILLDDDKDRFVYEREDDDELFLMDMNLGTIRRNPYLKLGQTDWKLVYDSYSNEDDKLRAYEVRIWKHL